MRVSASIGEPFLLSTYGVFSNDKTKGNEGSSASLFATHEKASSSSDGYATVTVRSEGVHVLDISTLHPVVSHSLGPSTTFSCPAITRNVLQGADNLCISYAAIESSPDLTQKQRGRTIWMWKENLSNQLEQRSSRNRKSVVVSHQISGLHICPDIPARLLAHSPAGDITVLDDDLAIKSTWAASQDAKKNLRMFVYSRNACSFLPPRSTSPMATILIIIQVDGGSVHVRILSLDDSDEFSVLGNPSVPIKSGEPFDVSCNNKGYLSFLTRDGKWCCYLLGPGDDNSIQLSPVSEPIQLTGLSFCTKKKGNLKEVSIVSLTSSHVLLSAITSSSGHDIVLLLWDLKYSVILASQSLPIPSTLTQEKDIVIQMTLVPASNSQALLLLSPHASTTSSSRSSVLVVPLSCPSDSVIANAMGRASSSTRWIKPPISQSKTAVLESMKAAMKANKPQAADIAFFAWEKRESKKKDYDPPGEVGQLSALSYSLIRDLVEVVLQPTKPANTPYSPDVVRYLLRRRLVSTDMVTGGLLACLCAKNDWQSIALALTNVVDLSEAELMECLYLVVVKHRLNKLSAQRKEKPKMQVDHLPDYPSLPVFLSSCVLYKTTPSALRDAIRRYFNEAQDLHEILVILKYWMDRWQGQNVKLWPSSKDIIRDDNGIPIAKEGWEAKHGDLPLLPNVLAFTQTLLDASFLILLQHRPSHSVLRAIHTGLEPQVNDIDELEKLRAPLEPFAQVQSKVVRGQPPPPPPSDWRQRRKQQHEYATAGIGSYQLEEIFL